MTASPTPGNPSPDADVTAAAAGEDLDQAVAWVGGILARHPVSLADQDRAVLGALRAAYPPDVIAFLATMGLVRLARQQRDQVLCDARP